MSEVCLRVGRVGERGMTSSNNFHADDEWQRRVRDALLVPWYDAHSNGRFVLLDRGQITTFLQREGIDTILQARDGATVAIEEKIVRWKGVAYDAYALETESCTNPGYERRGWMHHGQADYLLYAFEQADGSLNVDLIDFPKLRAWFLPLEDTFPTFQMQERNRSRGRVVKIAAVKANVPVRSFHLAAAAQVAA